MEAIAITSATIRLAAMNLLSMREHSVKELHTKLIQKYPGHGEIVTEAIQRLTAENLQCDRRFTEAFIVMRKHQGKGPVLIAMELKERGISHEVIIGLLRAGDQTWNDLASKVRQKKFGKATPKDMKEKAKQMRFLNTRGFSSACVQKVFAYIDEQ